MNTMVPALLLGASKGIMLHAGELVTGDARYGFGAAALIFIMVFFLFLLQRERQEQVSPIIQAEGKSRKWILRKATSLEGEGEYKGAGDLLLKLGEYEKAAKLYVQGKALGRAAEMFIKMNDIERAALAFEKRGMFKRAAAHYQEAQAFEKAAQAFIKADLYLEAAKSYEKGKAFSQAAEIYQQRGHLRKAGELFYRGGDRLRAAQVLEEALRQEASRLPSELVPSDSRMLSNLGFMIGGFYAQENQMDEAAAAYESGGYLAEAAAIHEQTGRYALAAQLYQKAGEPFKAATSMEKLGRKEEAAITRAEAYKERGQLLDAVGNYEVAGRNEEAARIYTEMGDFSKSARMYERAEKFQEAAAMYLRAEELDLAAASLERAGDYKRAAEIYGQVGNPVKKAQMLQLAGDLLEAGKIFHEHGHVENAIKALQRIEEDSPQFHEAVLLLGDIFRGKGIPKIALQHYRRVLTGKTPDRTNYQAMFNMALCLEALAHTREALEIYEAIIVVDYHHADVADRVRMLQQREVALSTPSTPSSAQLTSPTNVDATLLGEAASSGGAPAIRRERRYDLIEEIGRGGMGIVYKARDTVLDRIVAYKVLPANLREHPQAIKNFFREAKSAAALNHTNIVTVHDAGEEDGNYYIAMEYLKGKTVKQFLSEGGKLPMKAVVLITAQICKALTYAHDRKIVHRDIKSSNIMVTEDKTVKLMDFGLAKVIEEVKGSQTLASGTPYYMSPEQTLGKPIDHRTDLYSLGVTLFEMASGRLPFTDGEAGYHHVHTQPPNPTEISSDVPPAMSGIILKLMAKNPDERYQSAREVLDALRTVSDGIFSLSYDIQHDDDFWDRDDAKKNDE